MGLYNVLNRQNISVSLMNFSLRAVYCKEVNFCEAFAGEPENWRELLARATPVGEKVDEHIAAAVEGGFYFRIQIRQIGANSNPNNALEVQSQVIWPKSLLVTYAMVWCP